MGDVIMGVLFMASLPVIWVVVLLICVFFFGGTDHE